MPKKRYAKELAGIQKIVAKMEKALQSENVDESEARKICRDLSELIDTARSLHGQIAYDFS